MADQDWVEGAIQVAPPLNWTEIQRAQEVQRRFGMGAMFVLELKIVEDESDAGTFTRKTCEWLKPRFARHPVRDIADQVRQVVEALPGHQFHGGFVCYGEQPGHIWRVRVQGRNVAEQFPKIVWPD